MTVARFNTSLILGGLSGFLSVAFAAYATHVLKPNLTADDFDTVIKAINYQQLHSALMVVIGLAQRMPVSTAFRRRLGLASILYVAGIILFCGGIYIGKLTTFHAALELAPAGGTGFMLGWVVLASAGLIPRNGSGQGPERI